MTKGALMFIRNRLYCACLLGLAALILITGIANAQPTAFSYLISFQGRLSASDGKPLPDGDHTVGFFIYNTQTGGTALWTERQTVTQTGGTFSVVLGSVMAFPTGLFSHDDLWLGLQIGSSPEISPRIQLTPSPRAIFAAEAGNAATANIAATATNADTVRARRVIV